MTRYEIEMDDDTARLVASRLSLLMRGTEPHEKYHYPEVADQILAQIPKPKPKEPTEFGAMVKDCNGGRGHPRRCVMSRQPLDIREVAQGQVNFSTGGPLVWMDGPELDGAFGTIRRYGVAYVKGNAIDESDVTELYKAIRGGS